MMERASLAQAHREDFSDALPAARLQIWWLDPELTYGSAKPFVFTQGHSVCNRSFFPCFDTPAVKCTYSAVVKVGVQQPGPPRSHTPGTTCLAVQEAAA